MLHDLLFFLLFRTTRVQATSPQEISSGGWLFALHEHYHFILIPTWWRNNRSLALSASLPQLNQQLFPCMDLCRHISQKRGSSHMLRRSQERKSPSENSKLNAIKWGFETGPSFLFVLPEAGANKVRWVLTNKETLILPVPEWSTQIRGWEETLIAHSPVPLMLSRKTLSLYFKTSSDADSELWRWFRDMLPILQIHSSHVSIGAYYISVRSAIFCDILAYFVTS
jgi:hypothetical protein